MRVVSEATPWPEGLDRPVRAGVSSFGFSGTNAHVIVEGYPEQELPASTEGVRRVRLFPLSGKTSGALPALAGRYRDWLAEGQRDWEALSDAAWTAGTGRSHFGHRAGLLFRDAAELEAGLQLVERDGGTAATPGKTAFLFTGQGSQWAGMGRELYEREPVFREVLERCAAVFGEEGNRVAARP